MHHLYVSSCWCWLLRPAAAVTVTVVAAGRRNHCVASLLLLLLQLPRGALLFDVMGLGKTIQAIGAILATQRQPGEPVRFKTSVVARHV
jgi:SNF2 family DNA or RNA helicase